MHRFSENTVYPKQLTEVQLQVVLGSLLGDGYFKLGTVTSTEVAFAESCNIKQLPYLKWKCNILKDFGARITTIKRGKECLLETNYLDVFYPLDKLFYKGKGNRRSKVVPKAFLQKNLDALGLAVWYMDDGAFCKIHKQSFVYTYCFTKDENEALRKLLSKKFNFDAKVKFHKQTKKHYLKITKSQIYIFNQWIKPYVVSSMRYKLYKNGDRIKV